MRVIDAVGFFFHSFTCLYLMFFFPTNVHMIEDVYPFSLQTPFTKDFYKIPMLIYIIQY